MALNLPRGPVAGRAIFLCGLLVRACLAPCLLPAQDPPPPDNLKIVIIEGNDVTNNVKRPTARKTVVELRDHNNSPVPGAVVVFTLPGTGAGGAFVNGARINQVVTDDAGRARAIFRTNSVAGQFKIGISAALHGQTATAAVTQTNVIAGSAAAGAAGGGLGAAIASHAVLVTVVAAAAVAAGTLAAVKMSGGGDSGKTAQVSGVSISVP